MKAFSRGLARRASRWQAAGLALALIVWSGCSSGDKDRVVPVRPVRTVVVTPGGDTRTRLFPGKAEAAQRVELGFQVPGVLIELPVREGQAVKKGDVIGRLRPDEFQARLTALQGELDRARAALRALQTGERTEQRLRLESQVRAAEAQLVNARAQFDRSSRLVESRTISREVFDRDKAAYRVAQEEHNAAVQMLEMGMIAREEDIEAQEAAIRGLEGRVVEANLQLEDATLRAPYDGVIAQRFVEVNQNVTAGQPIVKFQDVDEIEVVVDVPESIMAADLSRADIVSILVEFSGAPGLQFPAHIEEIAQRADPVTQTFQVRVALQATEGVNVLPGMTSTVNFTYRRARVLQNHLEAPITALAKNAEGQQGVWLVGEDEVVAWRPVKLGAASGSLIEIVEGLSPGDRIAVAGVNFLREGMKVRELGDALGGQL
ncbi:MAG: efflux RND transporter periplasmic adaptor subunit [Pirellulales bacterium]|nr:efflux RND transporter periplasmic adaptor subunit [Pirellulales bacterium]